MRVYRTMASLWLAVSLILGAWLLLDTPRVHGEVSPDLCTDCAQFSRWLEDG